MIIAPLYYFNKTCSAFPSKTEQVVFFYSSAGNFYSGVSGRLTSEIVRVKMYDDCFADDFIDGKAVGQEQFQRIAVISPQRKQVAGMTRMRTAVGIIVRKSVGKRVRRISGTGAAAVDMERKNAFVTG